MSEEEFKEVPKSEIVSEVDKAKAKADLEKGLKRREDKSALENRSVYLYSFLFLYYVIYFVF